MPNKRRLKGLTQCLRAKGSDLTPFTKSSHNNSGILGSSRYSQSPRNFSLPWAYKRSTPTGYDVSYDKSTKLAESALCESSRAGLAGVNNNELSIDTTHPRIDEPFDKITIQPRVISVGPKEMDIFWEMIVDYCYYHAAEADCNFDWESVSSEDLRLFWSITKPQCFRRGCARNAGIHKVAWK